MTFRTVVVAGSVLLAASCGNGTPHRPTPAATTDAATTAPTAAPTTTERSTSVVIPRPTATPGPFGALLAVPAPFEASPAPLTVQEAQAQFTAGFQDELEQKQKRALVVRRPGWPEPLTLYAWRLRDERAELDFRRALYGALARSYGVLRTSRVGVVVLVEGATTGEAVAAWEPDRRTLLTLIGQTRRRRTKPPGR